MVQSTSPVHRNVALLTTQSGRAFYAAASINAAEVKEAIENWRVDTNVELELLVRVLVLVLWRHHLQEADVVVSVEVGHFL
jgi:hypothetical protein